MTTEFLYQSKRVQAVQGRMLMCPAGYPHTHRGNPPMKGEKFTINSWMNIYDQYTNPIFFKNHIYIFIPRFIIFFYAELIELVLLVGASIVLTVTVLDPATQWFIPLYLVGSIFGLTSAILRRAGFVILLCGWFTMMNMISLVRLVMDAM